MKRHDGVGGSGWRVPAQAAGPAGARALRGRQAQRASRPGGRAAGRAHLRLAQERVGEAEPDHAGL